jgi:hypothetical protein
LNIATALDRIGKPTLLSAFAGNACCVGELGDAYSAEAADAFFCLPTACFVVVWRWRKKHDLKFLADWQRAVFCFGAASLGACWLQE